MVPPDLGFFLVLIFFFLFSNIPFSKRKGPEGGIVYFELGPLQPHIVLKDLIKVAHPELLPGYEPYFLQPLD